MNHLKAGQEHQVALLRRMHLQLGRPSPACPCEGAAQDQRAAAEQGYVPAKPGSQKKLRKVCSAGPLLTWCSPCSWRGAVERYR